MRLFKRNKPEAPGITLGNGERQRLLDPFDQIAVYNGQIQLTASRSGAVLLVPKNAGAYLSGIVTTSWDGVAVAAPLGDAEQATGTNQKGPS